MSTEDQPKYKMGDNVRARRDGKPQFESARVVSVNKDGTYDLMYISDKEEVKKVQSKFIQPSFGTCILYYSGRCRSYHNRCIS